MPWPDGLEYAAAAVNLDRGLGPVLHFGGYSYPSRYTEGYPLILAAAYPILGHHVELLCLVTVAMGLVALVALYLLTFQMFGRSSAVIAGALLALSPVFITYSTLVLSDVPTMTLTILAALAFFLFERGRRCPRGSRQSRGLFRRPLCRPARGIHGDDPTDQRTVLIGIAIAMLSFVRAARSQRLFPVAIAFGFAFAIFPLWQAWTNYRYLGGLANSGYVFWVPEVYGSFSKTFNPRFLFGATMPGNPYGNVLSYVLTLTGLDGMLGDPGDPRYLMYPFAAAVFAIIGIVTALQSPIADGPARDVVRAGVSRGALRAVPVLLFYRDRVHPPRDVRSVRRRRLWDRRRQPRDARGACARTRKTSRDNAVIAGVIALDLMLAVSILAETAGRISATPPQSKMVPTLLAIRPQLPSDAIIDQQHLAAVSGTLRGNAENRIGRPQFASIPAGNLPITISRGSTRKRPRDGPARCRRFSSRARISMMPRPKRSPTRSAPAVRPIFW